MRAGIEREPLRLAGVQSARRYRDEINQESKVSAGSVIAVQEHSPGPLDHLSRTNVSRIARRHEPMDIQSPSLIKQKSQSLGRVPPPPLARPHRVSHVVIEASATIPHDDVEFISVV
jgi:hypothetical protein